MKTNNNCKYCKKKLREGAKVYTYETREMREAGWNSYKAEYSGCELLLHTHICCSVYCRERLEATMPKMKHWLENRAGVAGK